MPLSALNPDRPSHTYKGPLQDVTNQLRLEAMPEPAVRFPLQEHPLMTPNSIDVSRMGRHIPWPLLDVLAIQVEQGLCSIHLSRLPVSSSLTR